MSYISDLRKQQQVRASIRKNNDVFEKYLRTSLSSDDLSNVIDKIDHPEIHQPLIKNIDALVAQDNFDADMRKRFATKLESLPESKDVKKARQALATDPKQTALMDALNVVQDEPSFFDTIKNKIKSTYEDIETRVNTTRQSITERITTFRDTIKTNAGNSVDAVKNYFTKLGNDTRDRFDNTFGNVIGNAKPAVDMIVDRATRGLSDVKSEYNIRKVTLENERNLVNSLDKGAMTGDDFEIGLVSSDFPEVRYSLIKHADKLLDADFMTPERADMFYNAVEPYVANMPKEADREAFYEAFDVYDKVSNKVSDKEHAVDSSEKMRTDAAPVVSGDTKQAQMTNEETWTVPTDDGVGEDLSEEEFLNRFDEQYNLKLNNETVVGISYDDAYYESFDKDQVVDYDDAQYEYDPFATGLADLEPPSETSIQTMDDDFLNELNDVYRDDLQR